MEFESKVKVVTVSPTIHEKKDATGVLTGGKFIKTTVKHLDGVFAGKTFFANRTIVSVDRETKALTTKESVKVGQECVGYNRIHEGQIYTELSIASQVDDLAALLALAGAAKDTAATDMLSGQ